ncbi:MAG: efflux RND transporter permease subunit [Spirochaetales bacterium]|nr:efflux RND transporter permease subunit [Spirochaetales bacterium]
MTFAKRVLGRPMTMLVTFAIIAIAGLALTFRLPLELIPQMDMPILVAFTTYPMASPSEVEENVTAKIEEQVVNISGLKKVTSYSMNSVSMVMMEFDFDVDMAETKDSLRDSLSMAEMSLPDDAENPIIFEFDPNMQPFLTLALTGEQTLDELLTIAEDEIKPRLERINGVAQVSLSGGLTEIVRVDIYQEQLDALGLTISGISQMLSAQNMKLGAGDINDGKIVYAIQTQGTFESVEDLANTVVAIVPVNKMTGEMHNVLLRDVADVSLGSKDQDTMVLINGRPGIQISVNKTDRGNMVDVANKIIALLPELNTGLPEGSSLKVLTDDSEQVKSTLSQVVSSALYGVLFAILVLIFFLRQFRPTLIVAISIPVSLLITIGAMSFAGKSFNMITMTGLVLALGMIVDGSIVIIENIFRYREKGVLMKSAAELGTQEMIGPLIGSILTSVCVFLPILLFKADLEYIGIMFADMAFTVIIALLSSLVIALILVPVLAYKVFPFTTRAEKPLKSRFFRALDNSINSGLEGMKNGYKRAVGWCLRHKAIVILIAVLMLAVSIAAIPGIGLNMLPGTGETSIILDVSLPVGTSLDVTEQVMLQWQSIVEAAIPERTNLTVSAGSVSMMGIKQSHKGQVTIALPPAAKRKMTDDQIKSVLRQYFEMFPDGDFTFTTTDMAAQMSGSDISVSIKGKNMDDLNRVADEITDLMKKKVPEIQEVSTDQENSLPQLNLVLDRQKLFALGLNTATIAAEIRSQIAGTTATTYETDGEQIDVILQLREEDRNSSLDLEKIFVTSATTGQKIPFSSFGEVVKGTSPVTITRIDRSRTITLNGDAVPGVATNILQKQVNQLIDENIVLPEGITVENTGQFEMMGDTLQGMILVLFFATLLVMGVMVAQFESFKSPLIIMAMMPMLLIGVVLMHFLRGEPISMPSLLGVVMLLGIVVNNGIILVDAINLRRKRGETIVQACQNAAAGRLQPVLMTTLTTILAMVPMSFFGGEGTEMVQPMGLTVIGGLTSNTIVTLFLVPILYLMTHRKEHKKEQAQAQAQIEAQEELS